MIKRKVTIEKTKDIYGYDTFTVTDYETGEVLRWGIYLFTLNEWLRDNNAMIVSR